MNFSPPRWAEKFLRWYCHPDLLEEIEGDIYELFERRVEENGLRTAQRKFTWDVLRFFRWSNMKRSNSKHNFMKQFILLNSYFKVGFRNIRRHWTTSAINIFGLSIAIGLAITVFVFIDTQLHLDSFHSKADRIYQITNYVKEEDGEMLWADTPIRLGPQILMDHSGVEDYVRFEFAGANVKYGDNVFNEFIVFADPSLFSVFDFPVLAGSKNALKNKSNIAISRDMAIKYFANEDPIGKELSFKYPNGRIMRFVVGLVLDKYPDASTLQFGFYVPIDNFFDVDPDQTKGWEYLTDATFLLFEEGSDPNEILSSFDSYVTTQNSTKPEWMVTGFQLFQLPEVSPNSWRIKSSVVGGSHPAGRWALGIVAGLLLLLASFNYMNISIASATKRIREIAIRKVLGSYRKNLIHQFLMENMILSLFALIVGILISYFLFLPGFNSTIPITIPFQFSSITSGLIFFLGLLIIISLLSGAYPSFYISRFKPVEIMKGNQRLGQKTLFSKVLLGFQFFFSFTTIVSGFVFMENALYFQNKDWGYDPAGIFSIEVNDRSVAEQFKNNMLENPNVKSISISKGQVGLYNPYVSFDHLGKKFQTVNYQVEGEYFEVMNLGLKEGRWLNNTAGDQLNAAVINEVFAEKMGWEEAIGKTFTMDSVRKTVVGVVRNFTYDNFYSKLDAVIFTGLEDDRPSYVTVQANSDKILEVDEFGKKAWLSIAPNDPYERTFQENVLDGFLLENKANTIIMMALCVMAVILASLGLYGLISFNIQRKLKEFSIRKVLGAGASNIVKIAGSQYLIIILIAFVVGAPTGFFLINKLVNSIYPEPATTGPVPFIISILIILVTIVITVSGQILHAIKVNPVDSLRND